MVTRDEIIETVWGSDKQVSTNSVDVHIRYLRKIIDEGHKLPLIKTIHGYGYSISSSAKTPKTAEQLDEERAIRKKKWMKERKKARKEREKNKKSKK